jgi:hypothetical protein
MSGHSPDILINFQLQLSPTNALKSMGSGKTERGFDFLGYHFEPEEISPA